MIDDLVAVEAHAARTADKKPPFWGEVGGGTKQ
jgi:hypothetical protein